MHSTVWEREICNGETARANVDLTISIVHAKCYGETKRCHEQGNSSFEFKVRKLYYESATGSLRGWRSRLMRKLRDCKQMGRGSELIGNRATGQSR